MSSRFTPSGESRYTPRDRDRSPSRFERRGSSSSGPVRNSDNSYRPGDSTSNSRDISGVPRGPSGRGGGSYVSRGRGYGGRDSRDGRDGQFHRRDNDREFSRRDSDRRSPPSRNRSRTPPSTRDFRDARDNRDAQLRSLDMTRVTRESRDGGPLSAASASSEANSSSSAFHRGGFRNRGRGDWDRASSRRNFDDRDSFRTRSRSRDRWDRDRDRDRDYDRDSRREDDVRDRDNDRGRREPPLRPDSRDSVISQPTSATGAAGSDRRDAPKPPTFSNEASRRSSFAQPTGRPDFVRGQSSTQPPSSPIHYPQVPEFGAIKTSNVSSDAPRSITLSNLKDEPTIGLKNESADPTKLAPRGPKADLVTQQPPVAPKAFPRRTLFPDPSTTSRRFDDSPIVVTPSNPRFGPSSSPSFPQTTNNRPRNPTWSGPELMTRPTPGSATSQEIRNLNDHDTSTRPADIRIPTGPKGSRDQSVRTPLSARSNKSATISWINPNRPQPSAQHKPSIMQSMHHRKDDEYLSRASANSPSRDLRNEIRSSATGDNVGTRISSNNVTSARRLTLSPSTGPNTMAESRDNGLEEEDDEDAMEEEEEGEEDDEEEAEEEEEDDDDDEDDAELDQQDFERHEARFKKQIESLQSKLVLSPSLNPKILTALETIEIYASAIEDYKNGYIPPTKATEKARPRTATTLSPTLSTRPATMPTPPAELVQIKTEESKIDMKDIIMMDLSLEGLTYLDKDPLTPASFEFSGSEADELDLCDRIRKKLALDQNEDEQLQEKYKESYLQWREEVDKIDEEITQQESIPTRAATPVSAIGTETAGTPVPESGRRSTRNATEMDLERVIKESAEEAQAAEMAQVPIDMSVDADMTREAIIPEMLTEEDQTMFVFEDVNNRIPNSSDIMTIGAPEDTPVFKAYDYLPAEDDFNPEDQERFKDAYAKFPKQWGFIANNMNEAVLSIQTSDGKLNLPKNRDYHQCIFHYYMTKKQAKPAYKLLPNRKARAKKKTSSGVRRANQRSSMLGNGEDGSVRMSDTGRPKRAAAPNFNDKEKREAEALAQKAAAKERKASTLLNKPTGDGSAVPEKQPIRRVRKREGEKTTKRSTKATTALAPNVSPGRNGERGTSVDVQMQDAYGSRDLEGAQLLAQLQGYTGVTQTPQKQPSTFSGGSQNETWRIDPRILAPNQNLQLPSGPAQTSGMSVLDTGSSQHGTIPLAQTGTFSTRQLSPGLVNLQGGPASQASTSGGSSRSQGSTSSYWSVQEQTQFIELVKIYGRDWSMIGKFLPLKTETMIKNNFDRGGKSSGNDAAAKQQLEEYAVEAERRIASEGPPPPPDPPVQTVPPSSTNSRRRGAVPSSQRTLAPTPDHPVDIVLTGSSNVDSRNTTIPAISQASPQDRSHPKIAPAHQVVKSGAPNPEILVAGRPPQAGRVQPIVTATQTQPSTYTPVEDRMRVTGGLRDSISTLQSKRPRSISEQDRHIQDQPPKRQNLTFEVFTHELQQQEQQRVMNGNDSQQGYDYRQTSAINHPGYTSSSARTVSNPDENDRYRGRAPTPEQYHKGRESYGGLQYTQGILPPASSSHPGSMATVMGTSSSLLGSPGQRLHGDLSRPQSVATTAPDTSRPPAAPVQKRSNIMSLLNDDPPEEKKVVVPVETRHIPPPRHNSPMTNTSMYQTPTQSSYLRRDVVDPIRESHVPRGYAQPSYGSPIVQTQGYNGPPSQTFTHPHQHQQHIPHVREQYQRSYFAELPRSHEQSRTLYSHQQTAASPPAAQPPQPPQPNQQQSYHHQIRSNYEAPSHTHIGSTSSHSRTTSYSMHPNPPTTGPGQALAPSPYAAIRPSNMQSMSHHPPIPSPQHPIYHPGNQGPPSMSGNSRAATAYPGQLSHDHRRIEDHSGIRRYGTPTQTPPNAGGYGYAPPQ